MFPHYNAETIAAALRRHKLDVSLHYLPQVDSTNDEARRRLDEGAPAWTVVAADVQTAGRGRQGRRWTTPPGAGVLVSVALRPTIDPARLHRLTMLGAVAVMQALRQWFSPDATALKWPNDVLLHGRKVAGVLPEAVFVGATCTGAVLGIGLNVNGDFSVDADLAGRAISMAEAWGAPLDRAEALALLLVHLKALYPMMDGDALFQRWRDALAMLHQRVTVATPGGMVSGVAELVDADGALWLCTPGGERVRLLAGDVTLHTEGSAMTRLVLALLALILAALACNLAPAPPTPTFAVGMETPATALPETTARVPASSTPGGAGTLSPPVSGTCAWRWNEQPLPDLSAAVQAALVEAGLAGATGLAVAFGEDCLEPSGTVRYFATMQTDFTITVNVQNLGSPEALAQTARAVLDVLAGFPSDRTPGPNPGQITLSFVAGEYVRTARFSQAEAEAARAQGLDGAALLDALHYNP